MKNKLYIVLFLILGVYLSLLNPLPKGVHAWAQADRLSLSMNFLNTNNILEPSTHCLQTENGKVGCEFPIIPFTVAKISQLTNLENHLAFLYRNFVWLFWILGLLMLSKIFHLHFGIEKNIAVIVSILLHSSPILIFYGFNFLMDVPAYSLIITGFYFFISHTRKPNLKYFTLALIFSALAATIKLSALLYFGSFMAAGYVSSLFNFKTIEKKYLWFGLFVTCIAYLYLFYYYNYNHYVKFNKDNWSYVFLSETRPLKIPTELSLIKAAFNKWKFEIFTLWHWIFITGILIFGIFMLFKNNIQSSLKSVFHSVKFWFIIFFIPALLVLIIFLGKQFLDHDYYYIVPFMPILFLVIGKLFPKVFKNNKLTKISLIAFMFLTLYYGTNQAEDRTKNIYNKGSVYISTDIEWLNNGKRILTDARVTKNAKIFVLYEFSMNIHLVYFDRMGLIITEEEMNRNTPFLEEWIKQIKPEYFIFRNQFNEMFFARRQEFKELISPIYQNQNYTVWKLDLDKFYMQ